MSDVQVVVVGSIGLDTIETPSQKRADVLGGSASYACAAASFFSSVGMVGVVGTDFPQAHRDLYTRYGIDQAGLQVKEGQTFRWSGVYEANMDNRRTLSTDLNVFESFSPELPDAYRAAPYLFLANISPELQLHVLDQADSPRFVLADTMDLWIDIARDALTDVIGRVTMLTMNESEARHYTGCHNLLAAAQALLALGPSFVLIKKGEHGSMLFTDDSIFVLPAFPLDCVEDPTGAGDSFAGGFVGALAEAGRLEEGMIRRALMHGNIVASYGVQAFGLDPFENLERAHIDHRIECFRRMVHIP
jgi:sugar/nucleoside kinase (ribokinase family)